MIDRDTAEPLIRGLHGRLSNGRLPDDLGTPISNMIGLLGNLQKPASDTHEQNLIGKLVMQIRAYEGARGVVMLTTAEHKEG